MGFRFWRGGEKVKQEKQTVELPKYVDIDHSSTIRNDTTSSVGGILEIDFSYSSLSDLFTENDEEKGVELDENSIGEESSEVKNRRKYNRLSVDEIINKEKGKNQIIVESVDVNTGRKTVSDYIIDFTTKGMRISSLNGNREVDDILKFKFDIGIDKFRTVEGIITSVQKGNPDIGSETGKTFYGIKFTRAIESEVKLLEKLKGSITLLKEYKNDQ